MPGVGNENSHKLEGLTVRGGLALEDPATGRLTYVNRTYPQTIGVGPRVYAIGDSLTANGNGPTYITTQSWLMWSVMLSGCKIQYAGVAATGGYTAAQILATHVPTAIATQPDCCVVLAGTNDLPTLSMSTLTATLATIYDTLRGAGILPIPALLTPQTTWPVKVAQVNAWIRRYCAAQNLPCIDFHTPTADPSTGAWASGLNADNTHPNGAGAKLMGQALSDKLGPLINESHSLMSVFNVDSNNVANPSNAVFLNDGNSDGVPDGVSVQASDGTVATSLVTGDTSIAGSWFRMNKTAGTGDSIYKTAAAPAASKGDRIAVCGRINYVSGTEGTTTIQVWMVSNVGNVLPVLQWDRITKSPFMLPIYTLDSDVTRLQVYMHATGGTIDAQFAQITILNLTALGITY